ncbi:MAG: TolC family protein [Pleurocapsa sp. MO_192.B19]|nr:TolC family protein [Pleurocapsa sp. MO_192.B19]
MGKKSKFIQAASISTAVLLNTVTLAVAENSPNSSSNNYQISGKIKDSKLEKNQTLSSATALPSSIRVDEQNLQLSNFSEDTFSRLRSVEVAQSTDSTTDIIKPAQQSIPNTEKLNPSANPLSFPTQPDEVEVDTQKPITLEQAIELSLKNNKEIEDARINVERSEAVLRENRAALFPTLDLSSGLSYSNDAFLDSIIDQRIDDSVEDQLEADPTLSEEEARTRAEDSFTDSSSADFTFNTGVTLNYNIYDGGNRGASIRAAEKQLRSDELNLEVIVEQTRFETADDYYDLQNDDAQVKIEEAAVEDALQTLRDAQLLEKAGLGTRFDVLRAEVELAQARQRLSIAEAQQKISRRQLAETLSVAHNSELATADAIEEAGTWELSLPDSIVQAFKNRAELEQFLLQREIGEEQRTIALSAIRPTVSASASYSLNDDFEDDFDINDDYSVGLNINWRLFDGGAARSRAQQAEKDIESAETGFANQRNLIRFGVEQAYFGLQANKENIGTATKEVELAEESLRLARLRFQAGVGTQTDVIDAQTQLTTARGSLLTSIIEYNQSYIDLQRQVSNTPDNGLQDLP